MSVATLLTIMAVVAALSFTVGLYLGLIIGAIFF